MHRRPDHPRSRSLPSWKDRHGVPPATPLPELLRNRDLIAQIDTAVAETNEKVSRAEQIKEYRILDAEWTQKSHRSSARSSSSNTTDIESIYSR